MANIINEKPPKKSRAQKILDDIEAKLRELIKEKKVLWKNFADKQRELERLEKKFEEDWEEAKKVENKLIMLWDYWNREVEILKLDKQIQGGVLPGERKEITQRQLKLIEYNETLEKGFKERKIDAEVIAEIKKRLGIWDDKEEEKK